MASKARGLHGRHPLKARLISKSPSHLSGFQVGASVCSMQAVPWKNPKDSFEMLSQIPFGWFSSVSVELLDSLSIPVDQFS